MLLTPRAVPSQAKIVEAWLELSVWITRIHERFTAKSIVKNRILNVKILKKNSI